MSLSAPARSALEAGCALLLVAAYAFFLQHVLARDDVVALLVVPAAGIALLVGVAWLLREAPASEREWT